MTGPRTVQAAIVSVGNELLFGETVDTNATWLGRALGERGISVARRFTVGDDEAEIRAALDHALTGAGLVLVCGGLGPTPDDITEAAVSAHLGLSLVVDGSQRSSAVSVLRNPVGTAPGLLIEAGAGIIVLLPGVPRELRAIVEGDLSVLLTERGLGDSTLFHRVVHTTGIPESALAENVERRLDALAPEITSGIDVAYLPDLMGVDLRFTVRGGEKSQAEACFERLLASLDGVLRPWSFAARSGDLAEAVSRILRDTDRTLAVAESCTAGLVGKRMTDHPGSSDVFLGGVIVYSDEAKIAQLGVPASCIEADGAVSEVVAGQLASRVADRFGADTGIGVTGIAGPGGGSKAKPVGTVWIGTSVDGRTETVLNQFEGDRAAVRARAAQAALAQLHDRLHSGEA